MVTCVNSLRGQAIALERWQDLKTFIEDPEEVEFLEVKTQKEVLQYVNSDLAKAHVPSSSLITPYYIQKMVFKKNICKIALKIYSIFSQMLKKCIDHLK